MAYLLVEQPPEFALHVATCRMTSQVLALNSPSSIRRISAAGWMGHEHSPEKTKRPLLLDRLDAADDGRGFAAGAGLEIDPQFVGHADPAELPDDAPVPAARRRTTSRCSSSLRPWIETSKTRSAGFQHSNSAKTSRTV